MVGPNAFSTTTLDKVTKFEYNPTFTNAGELSNVANGAFAGIANGSSYFGPLTANNNANLTSVDLSSTGIEALNYANLNQSITPPPAGTSRTTDTPPTTTPISIQSGTFANATDLTEITLPASCSQFGLHYSYYSGAFARCTSLNTLNFKNFNVAPVGGTGDTAIQPGFSQITQGTWVQVANIMNALAYFGQQKIVANSDVEGGLINTEAAINAITYNVDADPIATDGTWAKMVGDTNNESTPVGTNNVAMILRGLAEWAAPRANFNYPINAYPAGSYGYSVSGAGGVGARAGETTTVHYPAGLGTSVSANFKNGSNNTIANSTTMSGSDGSLSWNSNNKPLLNGQLTPNGSGSTATADTNVVFNTSLTSITADSTITLTENSTRPQSVWYTVSASGNTGAESNGNITQQLYTPTADENNNIFAVSPGKIAGAASMNGGAGGVGSSSSNGSSPSTNVYTTAVGGTGSGVSQAGTPVNTPDANGLQTGSADSASSRATQATSISLSQNYLPLGITENVKDAYFNHNGIIWHYHNGFVAGNGDTSGITITGQVNAYIGGTIQGQNSGADYLSISKWTTNTEGQNTQNSYAATLANGVYADGRGLTSVGSLSGVGTYQPRHDVYGIDNADLSSGSNNKNTVCYPYVSLFGGKVKKDSDKLVASTESYSKNKSK